jgi:hypothetical protein
MEVGNIRRTEKKTAKDSSFLSFITKKQYHMENNISNVDVKQQEKQLEEQKRNLNQGAIAKHSDIEVMTTLLQFVV